MNEQGWITDTGASIRFPVYTRSNANDVLPEPVSPLGATLVWAAIFEGWRDGNVRNGAFSAEELAGDPNPVCGMFNGYFYVNASVVRVFGERSGAGAAAIDTAFFGNRGDTPPYLPHPDDHSEEAGARIGAQMGWVMSTSSFPELDASKAEADALRPGRPDLATLTDAELVARARSLAPLERRFFSDHVITSSNTAVGPTVLAQLTAAIDPGLMLRLVASSGDVDSALPSYAMWFLSREANQSAEVTAAFKHGVDGLLSRLRTSGSQEASAWLGHFERFLADYGSRGPNEWDPYYPSWESRPELALVLIDKMRGVADADSPTARHAAVGDDRDAATAEALAALAGNDEAVATLRAAQASATHFLAWRERSKTNCIKVINEMRMALLEVGRRATAAGHLREPRQIFLLTDGELDAFLADAAAFAPVLAEREPAWHALADLEPPYFVEGDKGIPPLASLPPKSTSAVAAAVAGDVLVGAPGCAGVAQGPARIITDPADPLALEPGDVLIAPQTDPSWTPLFVPAAAVVVDVGAMNSHAVIVSRELGIPCAVSVTDATRRIPDGAMVEVDGAAGTVRLL